MSKRDVEAARQLRRQSEAEGRRSGDSAAFAAANAKTAAAMDKLSWWEQLKASN